MRPVLAVALVPVVVVFALVAIDLWVYSDARQHAASGRPVTFQAGSFRLDTPEAWSVGVLILFVLFFPLYMMSRA